MNKYSEVFFLFGMCFGKAVGEEENPTAYHGGNKGIDFGGLEESCYH